MQVINAVSLTKHVEAWLSETRYPRILHVFDDACNLINERKDVLSVVIPQIGNGPFNLVVENSLLISERVSLETQISVSPAELTIGELTINAVNGILWNPRPNWEQFHRMRIEILHEQVSFFLPEHELSIPSGLLYSFTTSIVTADLPAMISAAKKIAGMGIGLTPTGDDFIMGAIYAIWIIHPTEVAEVLAQEVANAAMPLTTSLSAAWLMSAGRGEAGQEWHELLDALTSENQSVIRKRVKNILAVGETSGADALTGFLETIQSYIASLSRNAATSSFE
ncbi:MAG TPA: hypothetical protein DCX53_09550 [Anaerolineae bacterium]|nr:hypothetical protein [Anaerolineae bacterium]